MALEVTSFAVRRGPRSPLDRLDKDRAAGFNKHAMAIAGGRESGDRVWPAFWSRPPDVSTTVSRLAEMRKRILMGKVYESIDEYKTLNNTRSLDGLPGLVGPS